MDRKEIKLTEKKIAAVEKQVAKLSEGESSVSALIKAIKNNCDVHNPEVKGAIDKCSVLEKCESKAVYMNKLALISSQATKALRRAIHA